MLSQFYVIKFNYFKSFNYLNYITEIHAYSCLIRDKYA